MQIINHDNQEGKHEAPVGISKAMNENKQPVMAELATAGYATTNN